ncbi:MAG TPA: site-specific integrase [Bryobacteraceae bacterium]|jgi:Phage integrase, N-terminal SAM-like domain|nr:site-specific integrase [Bryobacteraceae bacterium]
MSTADVEAAADRWLASNTKPRRTNRSLHGLRRDFISLATLFLRFIGRFAEPVVAAAPFRGEMGAFLRFLDEERGLAPYTVELRQASLRRFLTWLAGHADTIGQVTPRTVTQYFSVHRRWGRASVKFHVNTLRSFFRFAAGKGWCEPRLAGTIDAPCIFAFAEDRSLMDFLRSL